MIEVRGPQPIRPLFPRIQERRRQQPAGGFRPGIVRVIAGDGVAANYGTGFLVAIREDDGQRIGRIVTAKHILPANVSELRVIWPSTMEHAGAALIARADRADVAILEAAGVPAAAKPFPLAESDPSEGQVAEWGGHGSPVQPYQAGRGPITVGSNRARDRDTGAPVLGLSGAVRQGDSGGPVTIDGRIVGLVSAGEGRQLWVEPVSSIEATLGICPRSRPYPPLPRIQPRRQDDGVAKRLDDLSVQIDALVRRIDALEERPDQVRDEQLVAVVERITQLVERNDQRLEVLVERETDRQQILERIVERVEKVETRPDDGRADQLADDLAELTLRLEALERKSEQPFLAEVRDSKTRELFASGQVKPHGGRLTILRDLISAEQIDERLQRLEKQLGATPNE